MKYLKLAKLAFCEKLKVNLILILQVFAVFVVINVLIGSVNSRQMLKEPYKDVLNKQGFVTYQMPLPEENGDTNYYPIDDIKSMLSDKAEVVSFEYLTFQTNSNDSVKVVACDDDFYSKLNLPLVSGKKGSAVITQNMLGIGSGDSVDVLNVGAKGNIKISGVLTNPTYIPWTNSGTSEKSDISIFYKKYDISSNDGTFIIMNMSAFKALEIERGYYVTQIGKFIYYPERVSEDIYQKDYEAMNQGNTLNIEEINKDTNKMINEDLKKYVPLCILVFTIVLIGVACSIAIQSLYQMKNYGIYYLCGMKWNNAVGICGSCVLIILVISGVLSAVTLKLLILFGVLANLGIVININNLYVSLIMAVLIFVISMIVPFVNINKQTPVNIIRRTKE